MQAYSAGLEPMIVGGRFSISKDKQVRSADGIQPARKAKEIALRSQSGLNSCSTDRIGTLRTGITTLQARYG